MAQMRFTFPFPPLPPLSSLPPPSFPPFHLPSTSLHPLPLARDSRCRRRSKGSQPRCAWPRCASRSASPSRPPPSSSPAADRGASRERAQSEGGGGWRGEVSEGREGEKRRPE
eukprot:3936045-Rhodomonas_salina.1